MNQVALVGNITDDPELRYTQSGAALAGFTVTVSHRSKHNGQWQDVNDGFFRCTMAIGRREREPQPHVRQRHQAGRLEGDRPQVHRYGGQHRRLCSGWQPTFGAIGPEVEEQVSA